MQDIPQYSWNGKPVATLQIIADVDSIGGYEWDRFLVLRDPSTGHLYTADGRGCSCNSLLGEVRTLADLDGPFTVHEAAERAKAWEADSDVYDQERRAGLSAWVVESLMAMERA